MKPKPTPAEWLAEYERYSRTSFATLAAEREQRQAQRRLLEQARALIDRLDTIDPPFRTER